MTCVHTTQPQRAAVIFPKRPIEDRYGREGYVTDNDSFTESPHTEQPADSDTRCYGDKKTSVSQCDRPFSFLICFLSLPPPSLYCEHAASEAWLQRPPWGRQMRWRRDLGL